MSLLSIALVIGYQVDGDEGVMVMVGGIRGLFFVRMFTLRVF